MKSSNEKEYETGSVKFVADFGKKEAGKENKQNGRPNCLSEEKLEELLDIYYSRPYSLRTLAKMFGVSRMTVWRAVQYATMECREVGL